MLVFETSLFTSLIFACFCADLSISQRRIGADELRRWPVREQRVRLRGLPRRQVLYNPRRDCVRVMRLWTNCQLQLDRLRGRVSERTVHQQWFAP